MGKKKIKDRKAFNFYRSYYEVALRLKDDSDRLSFLMSVIEMQFTGKEPEGLSDMAEFAFGSQVHSIKKQLSGFVSGGSWKDTSKDASKDAYDVPSKGDSKDTYDVPSVQEQVQVQEQDKEKDKEQLPTEDDFKSFAREFASKYNKDAMACINQVKLAHENYIRNGWKDAHGNPIKNWKNKLTNGYLKLEKLPNKQIDRIPI